jgi:hypothetical protein
MSPNLLRRSLATFRPEHRVAAMGRHDPTAGRRSNADTRAGLQQHTEELDHIRALGTYAGWGIDYAYATQTQTWPADYGGETYRPAHGLQAWEHSDVNVLTPMRNGTMLQTMLWMGWRTCTKTRGTRRGAAN